MKKKKTIQVLKEMEKQRKFIEKGFERIRIVPKQHGYYITQSYGKVPRVRTFQYIKIDNFQGTLPVKMKALHKKKVPFIVLRDNNKELYYQYGRNPVVVVRNGKFYTEKRFLNRKYKECSKKWKYPIQKTEQNCSIVLMMLRKLGYASYERKG